MADDEVKVLSDAKQLPLAERVAHKNWKVRSEAYEDISSSCQKVFSDEDPVLNQYGNFLQTICVFEPLLSTSGWSTEPRLGCRLLVCKGRS